MCVSLNKNGIQALFLIIVINYSLQHSSQRCENMYEPVPERPGSLIVELFRLINKAKSTIKSMWHFWRVFSQQWPRLSHKTVSMCALVCVCMCLIEPLRCSPLGLLDIISHYPRHSSNAAGAREHVRLVRAPSPLCLPTFSLLLFHSLPPVWAFPKATPRRPEEMQICTFRRRALM